MRAGVYVADKWWTETSYGNSKWTLWLKARPVKRWGAAASIWVAARKVPTQTAFEISKAHLQVKAFIVICYKVFSLACKSSWLWCLDFLDESTTAASVPSRSLSWTEWAHIGHSHLQAQSTMTSFLLKTTPRKVRSLAMRRDHRVFPGGHHWIVSWVSTSCFRHFLRLSIRFRKYRWSYFLNHPTRVDVDTTQTNCPVNSSCNSECC